MAKGQTRLPRRTVRAVLPVNCRASCASVPIMGLVSYLFYQIGGYGTAWKAFVKQKSEKTRRGEWVRMRSGQPTG